MNSLFRALLLLNISLASINIWACDELQALLDQNDGKGVIVKMIDNHLGGGGLENPILLRKISSTLYERNMMIDIDDDFLSARNPQFWAKHNKAVVNANVLDKNKNLKKNATFVSVFEKDSGIHFKLENENGKCLLKYGYSNDKSFVTKGALIETVNDGQIKTYKFADAPWRNESDWEISVIGTVN